MIKVFLFASTFLGACVEPLPPWPVVANDDDPAYCSEAYPIDQPPETCESSSYGDCCTWEIEEENGDTCRYDYCAFHSSKPDCEWELQIKECY